MVMVNQAVSDVHYMVPLILQTPDRLSFLNNAANDGVAIRKCLLRDNYRLIQCRILERLDELRLLSFYLQMPLLKMLLLCEFEPDVLSVI